MSAFDHRSIRLFGCALLLAWTAGRFELAAAEPDAAVAPETFGAAAMLPADLAAFGSWHELRRHARELWESRAVQQLVRSPGGLLLRAQIEGSQPYRRLRAIMAEDPYYGEVLALLGELTAEETFLAVEGDAAHTLAALQKLYGDAMIASVESEVAKAGRAGPVDPWQPDPAEAEARRRIAQTVIERIVSDGEYLRVPAILVGGRLSDPTRAHQVFDELHERLPRPPLGTISHDRDESGRRLAYRLDAAEILNPDSERQVRGMLQALEVPPEEIEVAMQWLETRRLTVVLAIEDGHLLLSVGRDTRLLDAFGTDASGERLAASAAFAPLRAGHRAQDDLLSCSYASRGLMQRFVYTADDIMTWVELLAAMVPADERWRTLREELAADLPRFETALREQVVVPGAIASATYRGDDGLHGSVYQELADAMLLDDEPLAVLAHGGGAPVTAAGRRRSSVDAYRFLVEWGGVVRGYLERHALAQLPPTEREEVESVLAAVDPVLERLHRITLDELYPALGDGGTLVAIDFEGVLPKWLDGQPLETPIPRFGFARELADHEGFLRAMRHYREAINDLLASLGGVPEMELPPGLTLPAPDQRDLGAGTAYLYHIPGGYGRDLQPLAVVQDGLLVVASSEGLAAEMLVEREPDARAAELWGRSAGAVSWIDGEALWPALERTFSAWFNAGVERGWMGQADPAMLVMVRQHVVLLFDSLGAIRAYRGSVHHEDGYLVRRSHLELRDLE